MIIIIALLFYHTRKYTRIETVQDMRDNARQNRRYNVQDNRCNVQDERDNPRDTTDDKQSKRDNVQKKKYCITRMKI